MKRRFLLTPLLLSLTLGGCASGSPINHTLSLPKDYYVEIEVTQDSQYGKVTTNYCLSESSLGWIYMKFGYDYEQYVYKPLSESKYIEYKYDTGAQKYKATMISDALQEQIDKGNVPLESVATSKESVDSRRATMNNYIIPYATMGSVFTKGEDTTILGRACETYTSEINAVITSSSLYYAVDKETGITMKMTNDSRSWFVKTSQVNNCVSYETVAKIPQI